MKAVGAALTVDKSHIDVAWLWPWAETVEVVRNMFQSVLDLMRDYPDFKFTMCSDRAYEWATVCANEVRRTVGEAPFSRNVIGERRAQPSRRPMAVII